MDLNRNFPTNWNYTGGGSNDPTTEIYRGIAPASEPEVRVLMKYFTSLPNVIAAFDIHSFSQLIMYPPSIPNGPDPSDLPTLRTIALGMADRIAKSRGTKYTAERSYDLYPVSGDVVSWWRTVKPGNGTSGDGLLAYTIELSPTDNAGAQGFILDPSNIMKVGPEIANGLAYAAGQMINVNSASKLSSFFAGALVPTIITTMSLVYASLL